MLDRNLSCSLKHVRKKQVPLKTTSLQAAKLNVEYCLDVYIIYMHFFEFVIADLYGQA
jgi:hypothetical protein